MKLPRCGRMNNAWWFASLYISSKERTILDGKTVHTSCQDDDKCAIVAQ